MWQHTRFLNQSHGLPIVNLAQTSNYTSSLMMIKLSNWWPWTRGWDQIHKHTLGLEGNNTNYKRILSPSIVSFSFVSSSHCYSPFGASLAVLAFLLTYVPLLIPVSKPPPTLYTLVTFVSTFYYICLPLVSSLLPSSSLFYPSHHFLFLFQ